MHGVPVKFCCAWHREWSVPSRASAVDCMQDACGAVQQQGAGVQGCEVAWLGPLGGQHVPQHCLGGQTQAHQQRDLLLGRAAGPTCLQVSVAQLLCQLLQVKRMQVTRLCYTKRRKYDVIFQVRSRAAESRARHAFDIAPLLLYGCCRCSLPDSVLDHASFGLAFAHRFQTAQQRLPLWTWGPAVATATAVDLLLLLHLPGRGDSGDAHRLQRFRLQYS